MLLILNKSMALGAFKAIKDLKHYRKPSKSVFEMVGFWRAELHLNLYKLVGNVFAFHHHLCEFIFLEDLWLAHGCQAHQILLDVIKVHVALSKQIPTRVNITLDEKGEH